VSTKWNPAPGELVRLRLDPTTERAARFVRFTGPENALLEVQRVNHRGEPLPGAFGAPRSFSHESILGPACSGGAV